MQELSKSKTTMLSIIGVVMAIYLVVCAPFSIDKSQDIVIKKLSGLSGLVAKEGKIRVKAGNQLIALAKADPAKMASGVKEIGNTLKAAAAKELKHPKLKGPGAKLDKAASSLLAATDIKADFLKKKGNAIAGGGNKMIKKSARLMKMVSLRMYISSYWRGLEVFGGLFLLLVVYGIKRQEKWAIPSMLTVLALAPIGGLYISLAGAVFFKEAAGFIPFGVSLVAFWATICIINESMNDKIIYLVVLTLLGMIGTDAFSFAEHGVRGILAKPYAATAMEPAQAILRYGGPIALYTVIAVFIAIYKLAAKQSAGWWFAVQAGLGIMAVGFPIDYLRNKDSFLIFGLSLSTYFIGALLGLILVVVLLLPYFKKELLPAKA